MHRVLVVDDEENLRLVVRSFLKAAGYEVEVAGTGEEALGLLEAFGPDLIVTDVRMPKMGGLDLLATLQGKGIDVPVIVMSAYGAVDQAIEAMQAGAYDYIQKPFKAEELIHLLENAVERQRLRKENTALKQHIRQEHQSGEVLSKNPHMQEILRTVAKIADHKTTVLVLGESGVGKELIARAVHRHSSRRGGPFVAVNCGAIPEALLESELFGHKRGAFTDAVQDKIGLFEQAGGGTLFLDELGELPVPLQVKLLRVLQEGRVRRVGDVQDIAVDTRIVAATHRDLGAEVTAGRFREDLYYRVNVLSLLVPPLRDRPEDIPLLMDHFIARNNARLGTQIQGFAPEARRAMLDYGWPGNVRELENTIERAMVLCEGNLITEAELSERIRCAVKPVEREMEGDDLSVKRATRRLEEALIRRALERTGGNRTRASELLELSHRALLYKIKEYGIA